MIPLTMMKSGDRVVVGRISGADEVKKHLEDLGFVVGTQVEIISAHDGDVIVKVRDSKLAITREMAAKIFVELA